MSGVLWRQDTFYVGSLKGVGRIYQQTFIDTYSKLGFAKLYDRKTPITAAAVCQVKSWLIHFNHTLSVEINTNDSIAALRSLRASLRDQRSRALLSHLEGVFLSCCRFPRHRVRCIDETGGGSWSDESLRENSSWRR